jgi:hypothetical protein
MRPKLPPPDPYESLDGAPGDGLRLEAPTVVFVSGRPSAQVERLSDAILDARPGALIVVAQH